MLLSIHRWSCYYYYYRVDLPNWSPPSPDKAIDAWNEPNLFLIVMKYLLKKSFPRDHVQLFSWFCLMFICGIDFHLKVDINAVDFSLSTGPNLKILVILKWYFWSAASIYCQLLKLANSHLDALELRCNVIASTSVAESWSIEIMLLLHSMLLILMATYVVAT